MLMKNFKISVLTKDNLLFQKILLDLPCGVEIAQNEEAVNLILADIDTVMPPKESHISMSRKSECDLPIPFPLGAVEKLISKSEEDGMYLVLIGDEHAVSFGGEKIHLTELEYMLFYHLYENTGRFTSKEELLDSVWKNQADAGIVNVYVYYLRSKLEKNGERIIISSRKHGYKINEKYIGGYR